MPAQSISRMSLIRSHPLASHLLAILAAPVALLAASMACSTVEPPPRAPPPRPAPSLAGGPATVSLFRYPWVWTDETGEVGSLGRWRGVPLVLTGIYTRCKSTCPRTIAKLREISAGLRRDGGAAQFLLVTLDPAGDAPGDLLRYKHSAGLPDDWHLLAGSARDTQELAEVLDIHVLDDGPHLMHEGKIAMFDARGAPSRILGGWALDEETPAR